MPRKYKRLSYEDRKTIEEMCRNGKKADEIAEATKNIKKKAGQGNELQILQPFTPVITGDISKAAGKRDFTYRKF